MSEPEVKFEIDEYGRIGYRVTNEGVLLSKDEKEFIINHITRMQAENAKLRELVNGWDFCSKTKSSTFDNCVGCPLFIQTPHSYRCARDERMRELGVEVD